MEYQFNLPTRIIFERGAASQAGKLVKSQQVSKVLILTDKGVKSVGLLEPIYQSLKSSQISFIEIDNISPNPKNIDCDSIALLAKEEEVNGIIAVGGGSVMDMAKGVGILLSHGGSINDWEGENTLVNPLPPLFCYPTTAGTGSEVTNVVVITDTKRKVKMGIVDSKAAPAFAIIDPLLTLKLPPAITASTGIDALTHAIEAYTSRVASPITDALALHSIRIIAEHLEEAVNNGSNLEAREQMMTASSMAGAAFGNADVGSVHCLSEAIGGFYDAPHGVINAIFLPYVFEINCDADIKRHSDVGYALGVNQSLSDIEAVEKAKQILFALPTKLNIPSFNEISAVNPKDFKQLARTAKQTPMDINNSRELTEADYYSLLQKAYDAKK